MRFQQTGASMPGGGQRAEGVRMPSPEVIVVRVGKDAINQAIDDQHPGLRDVLAALSPLLGSGDAAARIAGERIGQAALERARDLNSVPVEVTVSACTGRSVTVLQEILALGLDAYLSDDVNTCGHCGEPVHFRRTASGGDVVWFHKATSRLMCADGRTTAEYRPRRRRRNPHLAD